MYTPYQSYQMYTPYQCYQIYTPYRSYPMYTPYQSYQMYTPMRLSNHLNDMSCELHGELTYAKGGFDIAFDNDKN